MNREDNATQKIEKKRKRSDVDKEGKKTEKLRKAEDKDKVICKVNASLAASLKVEAKRKAELKVSDSNAELDVAPKDDNGRQNEVPLLLDSPRKSEKKDKTRRAKRLEDPSKDEDLSEKGKAALCYAYNHTASTETWKFNKAHQNWIIKNVLSLNAIPENYNSVIIEYLSGCQGSAKDTLIQKCKAFLDEKHKGDVNASVTEAQATEVPGAENEDVLAEKMETQEPSMALKGTRKRAKRLLKALKYAYIS